MASIILFFAPSKLLPSLERARCEFIVSIATKSDSVSDIEARFTDICKNGLSMDKSTMTADMKLFNQIKHLLETITPTIVGAGTPEEAEHYLFAFVLYSVRTLSESNSDNSNSETDEKGITLCQILRVAKLNLVDFFKEVPQFIVKVGPILCNLYSPNWENKLEAN
ncbi:retinoblastoma-related protein-like [Heracleum sosnowskyi]|uniref:Retinoblastoma-related protein-like n=1 Tax=Heracleum sosnowskyi TaxID=360622 RepID=A0AAD8JA38_9APIA|nr:retinoblastoma-related protein-like [Heracleum sosnowskyi]